MKSGSEGGGGSRRPGGYPRVLFGGGAVWGGGGASGTQKSKNLCTKNGPNQHFLLQNFIFSPFEIQVREGGGGVSPPPYPPTAEDAELLSKTLG